MKKWYLIKTKPRQEKIAVVNLQNQNYHVYCPHTKINKKSVILFPGYLFIQLDEELQDWSPIRSTKGVVNFVRFGLSYAKISDNVIQIIQNNEVSTLEKFKNLNKFKSGDKVEITEGVFKNCVGIFNTFKSDERVILLLSLMGQQQSIDLDKKSIIGL
jgi:transcriptional antiterminator RfaH